MKVKILPRKEVSLLSYQLVLTLTNRFPLSISHFNENYQHLKRSSTIPDTTIYYICYNELWELTYILSLSLRS